MRNRYLILAIILTLSSGLYAISLKDAVVKNLINANITSNGQGYYGSCIQVNISNKTTQSLSIDIESGLFLMPEDEEIQRMMMAQDTSVLLLASASKEFSLVSFCSEMDDDSPTIEGRFSIGVMAKGSLLKLAHLIAKKKYSSEAAQNAIWCFTNMNDVYSINGENKEEVKILREFVSKETNQKLVHVLKRENQQERSERAERSRENLSFMDTIVYANRMGGNFSLILFKENGEKYFTFYEDYYIEPHNRVTQKFRFEYSSLPVGTYYFRLIRNGKDIIYDKEYKIENQ